MILICHIKYIFVENDNMILYFVSPKSFPRPDIIDRSTFFFFEIAVS